MKSPEEGRRVEERDVGGTGEGLTEPFRVQSPKEKTSFSLQHGGVGK